MSTRRRLLMPPAAVFAVVSVLATGCTSSGVTAGALESSLSRTFANLYVLQQVEQGNPRPSLSGLDTRAACQKGTPASPQSGAGNDWVCHVTFLVAGPSTPVVAHYNVTVQTNGCYAADGDGPASVNGARTIIGTHAKPLNNPLWLIDGCFQVS